MFDPYNRMANSLRLQRTIKNLAGTNQITDDVLRGHYKYHYALIHKLKSSLFHFNNLRTCLENTDVATVVPNSIEFLNTVNMHLDSFFYCSGSALDILARETLVYFNISLPSRVYFSTAKKLLQINRNGDPIIIRFEQPNWKTEFSSYRNALTHEVLIGTNFTISINLEGQNNNTVIVFPLPDDPRLDEKTYRKNPNALDYCESRFRRILSLINIIHGEIESRARAQNSLPL
jgi:hypothetical protein